MRLPGRGHTDQKVGVSSMPLPLPLPLLLSLLSLLEVDELRERPLVMRFHACMSRSKTYRYFDGQQFSLCKCCKS